jgi:O-antigen ligase
VITAWAQGFEVLPALGLFRAYFVEPLLVFVVGCHVVRTVDHRIRLFRSFGIVACALAVWAMVQYATGWGIPHPWGAWPGRRATGPFPFPNALGLFLAPIAAFAVARLIAKPTLQEGESRWKRERVFAGVVFVMALIGTTLAASDGGLVAIAAAAGVALLMRPQTRRYALAAGVMGVAIFLLSGSGGPFYATHHRIRDMLLFQEWSGKVRTVIWKETVTLLQDHPVFGAGLAAYPAAIVPYHTATWMEIFQYPHNIVLNLWSETGVLGLGAFIAIILFWIRMAERQEIVIPVVLAILIHGLVDVPYFKNDLAIAFWLLVLLTTVSERSREDAR